MIPRRPSHSPVARLSALAGSGAIAALLLTGCAMQSGSSGAPAPSNDPGSASAAGASAPSTTKDGRYTATGHYTSPGGDSAVEVELTLTSGVVTAVTVTPQALNPTAQQYESMFSSGIAGKIVGKKITALNVTKVSGSSLTSQGFDKAIADIEQQAQA